MSVEAYEPIQLCICNGVSAQFTVLPIVLLGSATAARRAASKQFDFWKFVEQTRSSRWAGKHRCKANGANWPGEGHRLAPRGRSADFRLWTREGGADLSTLVLGDFCSLISALRPFHGVL